MAVMPRDLVALCDALRSYLPGGRGLTGVRQATWGLSNGTYVLDGLDRILRMPPDEEGLLPPYELDRQYAIYARVGAVPGGPPVPRVYEYCEDESVAGAPFFVMERMHGDSFDRHNVPEGIATRPTMCALLCKNWVATIASVHAMPPETLHGLSPHRDCRTEALRWRAEAEEVAAPTLVKEVLDRLAAAPPPPTGPATTVHGDPNLTNLLWDGPRPTALLDWELSIIGEPFSDIAFMLTFFREPEEPESWGFPFRGWWSKEHVVRRWQHHTGRRVASWRQHEVMAMARMATILCRSRNLVRDGRKTDPRVVEMSEKVERYLERLERRSRIAFGH
jgi:aminoglycoside phosphotransferase (APT) family kinase protein